jgi:hypothetical protein
MVPPRIHLCSLRSTKGKLDADLLEKLGMTRERLEQEDFLFFYQLILPIMPIGKIEGDPQVEHYPTVAANSNGYATMALRLGCKYCFYCSVAYLPAMDLPLTILLMLFLVHRQCWWAILLYSDGQQSALP